MMLPLPAAVVKSAWETSVTVETAAVAPTTLTATLTAPTVTSVLSRSVMLPFEERALTLATSVSIGLLPAPTKVISPIRVADLRRRLRA